jgi:hypothetical protein
MMPAGPSRSVCGILERTTIGQSGYSEKLREFSRHSDTTAIFDGRDSRTIGYQLLCANHPRNVLPDGNRIRAPRFGARGKSQRIAHGISLINHSIGRYEPKFGLYRKGHDEDGAGL